MVVTQSSDKGVRAWSRLNKQFADFETTAIKSEKGCVTKRKQLGERREDTQSRSERMFQKKKKKKGNQGQLFM